MSNESKATEESLALTAALGYVERHTPGLVYAEISAELRRQHAEIESLRAQLDDEADAMTVAYMHGYHNGKESQQAPVAQGEPVMWQYRWTNPGNDPGDPETMLAWKPVEPSQWNQTVEEKCAELLAYRYGGKPTYEVRALYTTPQQVSEPMTDELESALEALVKRCNNDSGLTNDPEVIAAEAALERLYKSRAANGIKGAQQ